MLWACSLGAWLDQQALRRVSTCKRRGCATDGCPPILLAAKPHTFETASPQKFHLSFLRLGVTVDRLVQEDCFEDRHCGPRLTKSKQKQANQANFLSRMGNNVHQFTIPQQWGHYTWTVWKRIIPDMHSVG